MNVSRLTLGLAIISFIIFAFTSAMGIELWFLREPNTTPSDEKMKTLKIFARGCLAGWMSIGLLLISMKTASEHSKKAIYKITLAIVLCLVLIAEYNRIVMSILHSPHS